MSQDVLLPILGGLAAGGAVALILVFLYIRRERASGEGIIRRARAEAEAMVTSAVREGTAAREQMVLDGRGEIIKLREEIEREAQRRRDEQARLERRIEERDRELEERARGLQTAERGVGDREAALRRKEESLAGRISEMERLQKEELARLERLAGLTAEEAKRELMHRVEDEARAAAQALGREIREAAKKDAQKDARRIIAMSIQRLAAKSTAESTVSTVALPSDEMKGRIIGREGRNIRAFEQATGVDVIIDDTPDTVVVSCFDPIRRETARRALEALIADGRIHPGRIEEVVAKARKELDTELVELGERAAYDTGVHGLHPELIRHIGRMRYRTSYGQNILEHSKEVAWLAGMMASELHLDVALAKRGALLHDIGKVLTHDHEGTHVELGVELARKFGEKAEVVGCIHAHHDDVPHETAESVLVQAADAISGSRPGARREAFETYVKRLTKLEELATGYAGVEKANVIQAGREVRVIVTPEQIDDGQAAALCDTIARKIEGELQYPGQIKVVVVRETRAVDFAR
ncbi:MAG TPA: ribonuclease Y [Anaeromyxobacteraceae bacterium]|nr:ribonuclease Y [Anaeromyxobacteraceae bacterium]